MQSKKIKSMLTILLVCGLCFFLFHFHTRMYPKIKIGSIDVGGLTRAEAKAKVEQAITIYKKSWPEKMTAGDQTFMFPFPDSMVSYDIDSSVNNAYRIGRDFSFKGFQVRLQMNINQIDLHTEAASIAAEFDIPTIPVRLEIKSQKVSAVPGQTGKAMLQSDWIKSIYHSLTTLEPPNPQIPFKVTNVEVSDEDLKSTVDRANTLLSKKLTLSLESDQTSKTWALSGEDIVKFVTFNQGYDKSMIGDYLKGIAEVANHPPIDAKFQFDESTGKVKEFAPPEDGIEVSIDETVTAITEALDKLALNQSVELTPLVIKKTPPAITLNSVNRLGIKEQLGVGISTYKHSILTRVHNVELAASRLNGILIKPGEEFSFNAAVGDVSAATGYQAAYVIRDGRTQLGDGGGLCQDSTTIFRAALDSGLPITMRRGHSYRVGYYEQNAKAGLDATVYAPSTDLKFLNDTPAYILIQTVVDSPNRTLKIYFFGTSDGRKSSITNHVVWDQTPALPDVNIDDPTLPSGVVKQVDWSAGGAKAKFTYTVTRAGQIIFEKTFLTNYQPWAAVYLHGTKTN